MAMRGEIFKNLQSGAPCCRCQRALLLRRVAHLQKQIFKESSDKNTIYSLRMENEKALTIICKWLLVRKILHGMMPRVVLMISNENVNHFSYSHLSILSAMGYLLMQLKGAFNRFLQLTKQLELKTQIIASNLRAHERIILSEGAAIGGAQ